MTMRTLIVALFVGACSTRVAGTPAASSAPVDAAISVASADAGSSDAEASAPDAAVDAPDVDALFSADAEAAKLVRELFERWRIVTGVAPAHTMDGGYRGMIRIEPALPIGPDRKHLVWVVEAMRDFDVFFTNLTQHAGAKPRYRFRPLTVHFMRSVAARTPSAYASDWTVTWNLVGSLNVSVDAARETLFHEIFHLNDFANGEAWSTTALGALYDGIVKRCGTNAACLAPYAPSETMVRGGTYYAFQPGNGVTEYAAELALRYYREQRAAMRKLPAPKRFKCGPPENGRAWALLTKEMFGGVDLVPACGT
jgi:hypothetical protein